MANKVLSFTRKQILSRSSIPSLSFFRRSMYWPPPVRAYWPTDKEKLSSFERKWSNNPQVLAATKFYKFELETKNFLEVVPTSDHFEDICVKILAHGVGSVDEARSRIYTSCASYPPPKFAAICTDEVASKIKELPQVRGVYMISKASVNGEYNDEDGFDGNHWAVYMNRHRDHMNKHPKDGATRDEIIDGYIKILAQVVGSEDEARKLIYSVSTKYSYWFGALITRDEHYSDLRAHPQVGMLIPDSYEDVTNKQYGGEPFINGQPVPYDPKYHKLYLERVEARREAFENPRGVRKYPICKKQMMPLTPGSKYPTD